MKQWYCVKNGKVYLVTADNIDLAKELLAVNHKISVRNKDLINIIQHHRWTKELP